MINEKLSEQLLLKDSSEGDEKAFRQLYHRYKEFVFNVVYKRMPDADDAKDVTQDIFVDLWVNKYSLENIIDFKSYLFVFARNHVVSAYRKKNVKIKKESYLLSILPEIEHSVEDHKLASELVVKIDGVIKRLPETTRYCYHLSKNEGKKNLEIAHLLNISEKTVRNNISEALKRVRLSLSKSHQELLLVMLYISIGFVVILLKSQWFT